MFYKIEKSKLTPIGKRDILERDVQRLVEANLASLFGLTFVETELAIENVRFDTLAFDEERNAPVIIEFKKTFEKSLFDQGLEYLNILFSRKADFTITLHKNLGISADPDKISWEDARVIFVGNRFSERQKRAVSFQGLPIELWSFEWLENDFFKLDRETLVKQASLSEFSQALGNEATPIEKIRREIKEYDREFHKKDATPKSWELFEKLESFIKDLGGFEVRYRKIYIGFYGKQSFCVVKLLKSKLQVEFGKEKDRGIYKNMNGIHDIAAKKWNHAFMFEVESEKDLDDLFFILKKAAELLQ